MIFTYRGCPFDGKGDCGTFMWNIKCIEEFP